MEASSAAGHAADTVVVDSFGQKAAVVLMQEWGACLPLLLGPSVRVLGSYVCMAFVWHLSCVCGWRVCMAPALSGCLAWTRPLWLAYVWLMQPVLWRLSCVVFGVLSIECFAWVAVRCVALPGVGAVMNSGCW